MLASLTITTFDKEEKHVNTQGKMVIDYDAQTVTMQAQDDSSVDFSADALLTWDSREDVDEDALELVLGKATNFRGDELLIDMSQVTVATILYGGEKGRFFLIDSNPESCLDMIAIFGYAYEFSIDSFMLGWQDTDYADMSGDVTLEMALERFDLNLRDDSVHDFSTELSMDWYRETWYDDVYNEYGWYDYHSSSRWGLVVNGALLQIGSDVYVDNAGSMRYCDGCESVDRNEFMAVEMRSNDPIAMMQVDMDIDFTVSEDDGFMKIIMDHCRVVWDGDVYVDTGIVPRITDKDDRSDTSPTPSTPTQNNKEPSTSPTTSQTNSSAIVQQTTDSEALNDVSGNNTNSTDTPSSESRRRIGCGWKVFVACLVGWLLF